MRKSRAAVAMCALVVAVAWTAACSRTSDTYRPSNPNTGTYSSSQTTGAGTYSNSYGSSSTGTYASNPSMATVPAPGSTQLMPKEGTIQSYNSSTHMLTLDDGTQYLLSDSAISRMPNGQQILTPGKNLAFNYFDQNGQKVIASIRSEVRHGTPH